MASSQLFWDLTLDAKIEDSKRTELSIYRELVDSDRFFCCQCRSAGKLYCCGKPCRLGKNPYLSWIRGTPRYILRNAVQVCCAKFDAGLARAKRREDEEFAMTRFDPIDELTPAGILRHTVPIPPGSVKVLANGFLFFSVCCPTEVEIEHNVEKGSLRRLESKSKRIAFLHWHPRWGRFTISVSYANAPHQRGAP
ncbi:hypothetical protein H632_c3433p0 [Helicosporidium sp. ATCC 50920]|nr:hypothetical protein H632_c3433p0 [Helicosporidium sp. ATCC 50920]|eukprot:KDD72375.1 hypothetical protein H632_c3433p0 [Helicosporidium sp. ATCC 50920]